MGSDISYRQRLEKSTGILCCIYGITPEVNNDKTKEILKGVDVISMLARMIKFRNVFKQR